MILPDSACSFMYVCVSNPRRLRVFSLLLSVTPVNLHTHIHVRVGTNDLEVLLLNQIGTGSGKNHSRFGQTKTQIVSTMLKTNSSQSIQEKKHVLLYGGPYQIPRRTCVIHKNLPGIYLSIFTNNIWSFLLWPPVILLSIFVGR